MSAVPTIYDADGLPLTPTASDQAAYARALPALRKIKDTERVQRIASKAIDAADGYIHNYDTKEPVNLYPQGQRYSIIGLSKAAERDNEIVSKPLRQQTTKV